MRRILLAALAALTLLPALSWARAVVVLYPTNNERTTALPQGVTVVQRDGRAAREMTTDILRHFNPNGFDVVQPTVGHSSLLARGIVGTTQYDIVVWAGARTSAPTTTVGNAGCYLDSLLRIDGYMPTTPQVLISASNGPSSAECSLIGSTLSETNTTFVLGDGSKLAADPVYEGPGYGSGRFVLPGTQYMWPIPVASCGIVSLADTTLTSNGYKFYDPYIRTIIGSHATNWSNYPGGDRFPSGGAYVPPSFRDSLMSDYDFMDQKLTIADQDSAYLSGDLVFVARPALELGTYTLNVWQDGNQKWNDPTAAPIFFCHWNSGGYHHIGGADKSARLEGDPSLILLTLAAADSASHALFGEATRPYALAVQVAGLATSGGMYLGGGGQPVADSTGQNMAMDSLRTLNIPITGLFRADSIFAFQRQFRSWVRHGFAVGIERYANSSLTLSQQRDTLAYYSGLYGRTRFDHVLGGNKRDFTATTLGVCSPALPESVAYAIRYAGFTGLSMNAEEDSLLSATNTPAWNTTQRVVPAADGSFLNVWTYPGYNHRGAAMSSGRDSFPDYPHAYLRWNCDSTFASDMRTRTMYGMMFGYWHQPINRNYVFCLDSTGAISAAGNKDMRTNTTRSRWWRWTGEPERTGTIGAKANLNTGTNIVRISASNLGSGQWGTASPNMPGWYQVKYTVNTALAINQLAGRTLVRFVYPDQLTPKDMQR